jgi:hypothetical protein
LALKKMQVMGGHCSASNHLAYRRDPSVIWVQTQPYPRVIPNFQFPEFFRQSVN